MNRRGLSNRIQLRPLFASNRDPLKLGWSGLIHVVHRRAPRTAARSVGRRWWCCVTTAGWSAPVQVFGRRDDETIHALRRCFDGHVWTPIVSSGDVAVMVSRLRQRALVTGPMDED